MANYEAHNRAALDQIDRTLRSMALRPRMHGNALAVECQAQLALSLRRTLLGVEAEKCRSFDAYWKSVYGGLIRDWFGMVNVGASAFMDDDAIGRFVAELYYRERQRAPDPGGSGGDIEGRIAFWTEFLRLKGEWQTATGGISVPQKRLEHPAYRAVVALGWPVVRPVLMSLVHDKDPDMWGPALREITGENPVRKSRAGDLRKVAKDWIRWGSEIGLVDDAPL